MNNFMNEVLSKIENSSDSFFQSKHINKRREDFKKELDKKKEEANYNLSKGLEEIKIACKSKYYKDEKEKLFLELFSKLHIDANFYKDEYIYGYCLLDSNDKRKCFYNLESDRFWIEYKSIWNVFEEQFNMNYVDTQSLMNKLLREHLKLYDIIACRLLDIDFYIKRTFQIV